ncbi:glycoside hydrolase family 27 protein [Solihabitans fulvus]|uniref:Alpha-galactosidase n=1 Tax=Solihabitans fulvus TaxID=1892852 RepID=A0A5B2XT01_9PSEU|nr:glycoside hydrolase family 27 protein [Solihabitans fulvus]KAA2266586.1 glycoside hydrolase family 27 protein [Solihabitans fulvus]
MVTRWLGVLLGATLGWIGVLVPIPGTPPAHPVVAATPPMGWSSWSSIRGNVSEAGIEAQAKVMHDSLLAHGYRYVNIDAGWSDHLDGYGRNTWNTTKFPHGIPTLAAHLHALGLRFGLYLVPGIPKAAVDANLPINETPYHAKDIADTSTLGNTVGDAWRIDFTKPGAARYVQSQADLLASWGVDYVKMDFVGPGGGRNPADNRADIAHWHDAIAHTGRPIHLELSNSLSFANADTWRADSNGWRIEGDVECYSHCPGLTNWDLRVAKRFADVPKWVPFAGPGGWNDLDSLEIGNGSRDGLTPDERQSTMTLWAASAAPLLLGTDLTTMDSQDLRMLTNDEVVAVDQAGHPAHPVSQASQQQTWFSDNHDGSYTVALFNLDASTATVTATWRDLGFTGRALVRDLWTHTELGPQRDRFAATLPAHGSRLLRVIPVH